MGQVKARSYGQSALHRGRALLSCLNMGNEYQ
jgi:hypothetical protein